MPRTILPTREEKDCALVASKGRRQRYARDETSATRGERTYYEMLAMKCAVRELGLTWSDNHDYDLWCGTLRKSLEGKVKVRKVKARAHYNGHVPIRWGFQCVTCKTFWMPKDGVQTMPEECSHCRGQDIKRVHIPQKSDYLLFFNMVNDELVEVVTFMKSEDFYQNAKFGKRGESDGEGVGLYNSGGGWSVDCLYLPYDHPKMKNVGPDPLPVDINRLSSRVFDQDFSW